MASYPAIASEPMIGTALAAVDAADLTPIFAALLRATDSVFFFAMASPVLMVASSATTPADFTALAVFFVSFAIPFDVSLIVLTSLGLLILFLTTFAAPTPVPAAALPAATFSPAESAFFPRLRPFLFDLFRLFFPV